MTACFLFIASVNSHDTSHLISPSSHAIVNSLENSLQCFGANGPYSCFATLVFFFFVLYIFGNYPNKLSPFVNPEQFELCLNVIRDKIPKMNRLYKK